MWVSPLISDTKTGHAATAAPPNPFIHNKKPTCITQVGFTELTCGFEPVTSSLPQMCLIWCAVVSLEHGNAGLSANKEEQTI